jgi:hypothetical protein
MSKRRRRKRALDDPISKREKGKRETFVYPDECVSEECAAEVEYPQVVERPKGKPLYMKYQVWDLPPRGFSSMKEVEETLAQIKQDVELGVIPVGKGIQRLGAVRLHIEHHPKGIFTESKGWVLARKVLDRYEDEIRAFG